MSPKYLLPSCIVHINLRHLILTKLSSITNCFLSPSDCMSENNVTYVSDEKFILIYLQFFKAGLSKLFMID